MKSNAYAVLRELHTVFGTLFAVGVFLICWGGTLSVFMAEIEQWERPVQRIPDLGPPTALDDIFADAHSRIGPDGQGRLTLRVGLDRNAVIGTFTTREGERRSSWYHPYTGAVLPPNPSGVVRLLFDLHETFALPDGRRYVAVFAMAMLIAMVTGILIHRRLLRDVFVWRGTAETREFWRNAHNQAGVAGLPFLFVITYTGLWMSLPLNHAGGIVGAYEGDVSGFAGDVLTWERVNGAGATSDGLSLQFLHEDARRRIEGLEVNQFMLSYPVTTESRIRLVGQAAGTLTQNRILIDYAVADGAPTRISRSKSDTSHYLYHANRALHYGHFAGTTSRVVYFVAGILVTSLVPTGLILLAMRLQRYERRENALINQTMAHLSLCLVVGVVVGSLLAFAVNKVLPMRWPNRVAIEEATFFAGWLLWSACAFLRWRGRALVAAALLSTGLLALLLPILNATITGHHPAAAIRDKLPAVFAFDSVCIAVALGCLGAFAVRWRRRASGIVEAGAEASSGTLR